MKLSELIHNYNGKPLTPATWNDIFNCIYQYETKDKIKEIFTSYSSLLKEYDGLPINNLGESFIRNDVYELDAIFTQELGAEVKLKIENDWLILSNYLIPSDFLPILVNLVVYLDKTTKQLKCEISY